MAETMDSVGRLSNNASKGTFASWHKKAATMLTNFLLFINKEKGNEKRLIYSQFGLIKVNTQFIV